MTKLQYSLTAKNIAVNSWDLSDSPAKHLMIVRKELESAQNKSNDMKIIQ